MKRRWLQYSCSLCGVTEKTLVDNKEFLAQCGIESIVGFNNQTYGVQGEIVGDTRTEVNCEFKLLKEKLKKYFGIKKIVDMMVAKGDCD